MLDGPADVTSATVFHFPRKRRRVPLVNSVSGNGKEAKRRVNKLKRRTVEEGVNLIGDSYVAER